MVTPGARPGRRVQVLPLGPQGGRSCRLPLPDGLKPRCRGPGTAAACSSARQSNSPIEQTRSAGPASSSEPSMALRHGGRKATGPADRRAAPGDSGSGSTAVTEAMRARVSSESGASSRACPAAVDRAVRVRSVPRPRHDPVAQQRAGVPGGARLPGCRWRAVDARRRRARKATMRLDRRMPAGEVHQRGITGLAPRLDQAPSGMPVQAQEEPPCAGDRRHGPFTCCSGCPRGDARG